MAAGPRLADTVVKGAPVPTEIEDPRNIGINKEPAHASLMPYANLQEALKANRHASSLCRSLNGLWKFNWVSWPQQRPVDFYKTAYDVSAWKDIKVPSNWQIEGYGTPYYSNFTYIFKKDFPHIMSEPPRKYTAYAERNPVGSYRRDFEVPADWKGRRIFITFDGVDAGFFIWVNGKKVGYSVNSRNAAEFDITKYVQPGKNMVAVEVYRFTTGSYLEDQDMWRLSGIFRNVSLWSTPQEHIRDYFIKTNLDKQYKNAVVEVNAQVKNYGSSATKANQLSATLYNGSTVVKGATGNVPALKPGEETTVKLSFPVNNPQKWTAETPKLYTTVLSLKNGNNTSETISSRTGFRTIEIKGRIFTINGVRVKLKGVNRHENWPEVGHAVTEEQMIRDIVLIKQANCNHVRTCHYSDDPRWYELCDQYGIYLVAEANLENHGAWDDFNEDPRIKDAIIDRNVANVQNFKNHPSVIIWSLGNECGSGGSNFRAALDMVKKLDPTRPTHYQGFGIGEKNPADIDSDMYTDLENTEKIANDDKYTKPFYLCEYAHAMFNSMGSVDEYNDLFDKYPTLLGGCIWEWQDQGIWNRRDPKHPILAFGGGFGEYPNDHYFIHKGVVASDRSLKPHYPQLKHAYQWIGVKAKDITKGIITIKNKYQFINLDGFSGNWELSENGVVTTKGNFDIGKINPGEEKDVKIPYDIISKPKPDVEYFLRISFTYKADKMWAKKGFEAASQQLEFPVKSIALKKDPASEQPLELSNGNSEIKVKGKNFKIEFDKKTGTFSKLEKNGENVLEDNGGPKLHLWRAPHRNDDMWANEGWEKNGIKSLTWVADSITATQPAPNRVVISASLTGTGKQGFTVHHKVTYEIWGNGVIKAQNKVSFSDPKVVLARLGVRLFLKKDLDQFSYFGRGPMENYADRKSGFDIGVYSSTVKQQVTPYEKPMENGNHEDIRWAKLTGKDGSALTVKHVSGFLQVSAQPHSDEEMEPVEYKIDLPKSKATVLTISTHTLGVGSNSCGPRPLEKYTVYAKPDNFTYEIDL
ncbi:beta-galactosidase [Mucilaginibacter lappiensis]|nr:beta-galactosidase [Mucilaginibacter lappiensis]